MKTHGKKGLMREKLTETTLSGFSTGSANSQTKVTTLKLRATPCIREGGRPQRERLAHWPPQSCACPPTSQHVLSEPLPQPAATGGCASPLGGPVTGLRQVQKPKLDIRIKVGHPEELH